MKYNGPKMKYKREKLRNNTAKNFYASEYIANISKYNMKVPNYNILFPKYIIWSQNTNRMADSYNSFVLELKTIPNGI